MGDAHDLASSSFWVSVGITLIALFLGLRQWYERRARDPDLSDFDRGYFFRQDVRRGLGVIVMMLLALGIWVGTRIEPMIAKHANLDFVKVWAGVIALIVVMLTLAFLDWWATRLYARRLRRSIARERLEILRQALDEAKSSKGDRSGETDEIVR